jgi:hypothetical protein
VFAGRPQSQGLDNIELFFGQAVFTADLFFRGGHIVGVDCCCQTLQMSQRQPLTMTMNWKLEAHCGWREPIS